jgi:hypothetical protein
MPLKEFQGAIRNGCSSILFLIITPEAGCPKRYQATSDCKTNPNHGTNGGFDE